MKYKSKRVGQMSAEELGLVCQGLTLKISVITGWQIPENSEYITILNDQLKKKFVDDYQDLNADEFEYAMRTYGTKIKDWGKGLNLALIDDAICEYMGERQHISSIEEQKRNIEPQKSIENTGPVDWSEEWEKVKGMARDGEINALFLTDALYNWMDKHGLITISPKEKWQMVYQAAIIYRMELQHENPIPTLEVKAKLEMLDNGKWKDDPDIATRIWIMAKKECIKIEALKAVKNENVNR